jgi:multiple sugar transport system substrate-binding protein
MYGKWTNFGPPGIINFDWQVPAQQFSQGLVFAFLDINLFVPTLEDPAQSRVAGNVGYAPVPEGPCGRSPFIGGWGYTINPFSSQKEAAWYFIQWFTSKSMNLNMKMEGWPSPRASAWSSEEFKQVDPNPEFTEVVLESLAIANAEMNPPVAPGREAREVVGIIGTSVIQGVTGDALKAVADAQNIELQRLIDAME